MTTATKERQTTSRSASVIDALVQNRALVEYVPIDDVHPSKRNQRRELRNIDEMAASITAVGVLEPLLVTRDGATYEIVAGARRHAGAKKAGLDVVPVIIRNLNSNERREVMLIENVQRDDLSPIEEGLAYKELIEELGYGQRELAERIGRSQAHISKRIALTELPRKVQDSIDSGGINLSDALELVKLKDMPKRLESVMKDARSGRDISSSVVRQLDEHRRAEKVGAEVLRLKSSGVTVVNWPANGFYGTSFKRIGRSTYDGLDHIDVRSHSKEPCHAATVDPEGKTHWVCTKPKNHPAPKSTASSRGGLSEQEKKQRARKRDHNKQRRAAQETRWEFLRSLLTKRIAQADLVEILVGYMASDVHNDYKVERTACELLGVTTKVPQYGQIGFGKPLRKLLAGDDSEYSRTTVAVAFATVEHHITQDYGSWNHDHIHVYFEFLESKGYGVSPAERLELSGKAP